ncbi:hypothetical protein [Sphingobium sp.]|nr:hypothetical protein [Sphingobium sp.]
MPDIGGPMSGMARYFVIFSDSMQRCRASFRSTFMGILHGLSRVAQWQLL